jgi:hypothetical protein
MDTDKILKAIRILIKEEIKKTLPPLIKEVVKKEIKGLEIKLLKEQKLNNKTNAVSSIHTDVIEEDPFDKAERILLEDRNIQQQFTKNDVLNKVLNETAQQSYGTPNVYDSTVPHEVSERTIGMTSTNIQGGNGISGINRSALAQKMGYGDMVGNTQPTAVSLTGKTVNLDDPSLSAVKTALTRDYSELVSRFKK